MQQFKLQLEQSLLIIGLMLLVVKQNCLFTEGRQTVSVEARVVNLVNEIVDTSRNKENNQL